MKVATQAQIQLPDGVVLDARRAVWFSDERVLAVADLHLGYAWAHRLSGQLMPIPPTNDTLARLVDLKRVYAPREIVVLGDIVHRAMALPVLEEELREVVDALARDSKLTLLAGNHDRELQSVLKQWSLPIDLVESREIAGNMLVHGDKAVDEKQRARRIFMGHEHPAISIGDGVTTSQKCPCFLVSDRVIVLPAFSRWAAGTDMRVYQPMSEMARAAKFTEAVAICGDKLLPVSL